MMISEHLYVVCWKCRQRVEVPLKAIGPEIAECHEDGQHKVVFVAMAVRESLR